MTSPYDSDVFRQRSDDAVAPLVLHQNAASLPRPTADDHGGALYAPGEAQTTRRVVMWASLIITPSEALTITAPLMMYAYRGVWRRVQVLSGIDLVLDEDEALDYGIRLSPYWERMAVRAGGLSSGAVDVSVERWEAA